MSVLLYILGILATFYVLYVVVDKFLVPTIYLLKDKFNLSDDQTGALTSFVSSAPELSVSMISLALAVNANDTSKFNEVASLGPASVIGSALFSVLFIVGASSWFAGKKLTWHSITRDMIYYIFAVVMLLVVVIDNNIEFYEGILLLLAYVLYTVLVGNWPRITKRFKIEGTKIIEKDVIEKEEELINIRDKKWSLANAPAKLFSYFFFTLKDGYNGPKVLYNTLFSVFLVIISSYFMVDFAQKIAQIANIPSAIIGLTILAAGTSVPDLLASLKTAREGYADTAVTNAIGSNVFDVLGNLGLTWTIGGFLSGFKLISVDSTSLFSSIILLIASSVVLILILVAKNFNISKPISIFLMLSYITYVIYTCYTVLR
jgi:K+-dependent Na+/Ca+ exchanger-like protein